MKKINTLETNQLPLTEDAQRLRDVLEMNFQKSDENWFDKHYEPSAK